MTSPASLRDVLPAAASVLGVAGAVDRLGLAERLDGCDRVAVVLVDGLGLHLLPRAAPHAPLLASVLAGGTGRLDELACTFPSTTPTSLVSLATGVGPGEHGVLGFTVRRPGTDSVLTHILWGEDPDPRQWQPVPTWFERVAAAGVGTRVVLPAVFERSGLTRAAYRGARYVPVAEGADPAALVVEELRSGPGLVYGYTSVLDTAAHLHGIASPQWARAAAQVDALLTSIVERLPARSALLVTADHGGLDVPLDGRVDLGTDPALAAGVRVVAGEPRVRYLHVQDGATADVAAAWASVLGDRAEVLDRDAAIGSGLFGPTPDAHRDRIGDLVVICRGDTVVLATGHEPKEVADLLGFHGALTPEETAIPLISVVG